MTREAVMASLAGQPTVVYVMYDRETGRIVSVGGCLPGDVERQKIEPSHELVVSRDLAAFHGVTTETHYVADGAVRERPSIPDIQQSKSRIEPDGVDAVTWTGVPAGSVFMIGTEVLGTVDDSVIVWTTDQPAEFDITIEAWPARAWRGRVRAL